jgi:hypothetical protein
MRSSGQPGTINGRAVFGPGFADSETYSMYKAQDYKFVYYPTTKARRSLFQLEKRPPVGW